MQQNATARLKTYERGTPQLQISIARLSATIETMGHPIGSTPPTHDLILTPWAVFTGGFPIIEKPPYGNRFKAPQKTFNLLS